MDDGRRVLRPRADTKLSREQKAGFIFVIVCGFGALILGGQYLWTHMAAPFALTYSGPRFLTGEEEQSAEVAKQKQSDTDLDGVNDYDELYIYKTSPYLSDSDSDGQTDGAEITGGQDPNCALGATCGSASSDVVDLPGASADLDAQGAELQARQQALDAAMRELQGLPPADIRVLLVESGADPAELEAMSDEEVNAMYQNILLQLQQQGALQGLVAEPAPVATP